MREQPRLTKDLILQQAEELFLKHGFSKVTVDEIARELGMSKKTIYQNFTNKKTILKNIIDRNQQQLIASIDEKLNDTQLNFMQKMQTVMEILAHFFARISPYFIRNLKQHFPDLWLELNEFKQKQSFKRIQLLVQQGIKEQAIRNDIPPPLLISFYFYLIENVFNAERLTALPYSTQELFAAAVKIIYGGILTDSARKTFFKGGSDAQTVRR